MYTLTVHMKYPIDNNYKYVFSAIQMTPNDISNAISNNKILTILTNNTYISIVIDNIIGYEMYMNDDNKESSI